MSFDIVAEQRDRDVDSLFMAMWRSGGRSRQLCLAAKEPIKAENSHFPSVNGFGWAQMSQYIFLDYLLPCKIYGRTTCNSVGALPYLCTEPVNLFN